jgi:hypothetical protein
MAHDPAADSAKRRLENSRRALMQNMMRNHTHSKGDEARTEPTGAYASSAEAAAAAGAASEGVKGLWRTLSRTARAWWRSHPAHMAVEVGQPLLEKYAAANPLKLLAISAAIGGAIVLAKPWRLISVTGLLIAALRSTQMSGLVASLLSPEPHDPGRAGRD